MSTTLYHDCGAGVGAADRSVPSPPSVASPTKMLLVMVMATPSWLWNAASRVSVSASPHEKRNHLFRFLFWGVPQPEAAPLTMRTNRAAGAIEGGALPVIRPITVPHETHDHRDYNL